MYYAYRGARGLFSWADSASTELRRGISPMLCIRDAYDSILKDEEVEVGMSATSAMFAFIALFHGSVAGSSTACLIELDATSGILVAAKWASVFYHPPWSHITLIV